MKVLITGASSDIGLAICEYYIEQGWKVLAHHRSARAELTNLTVKYPKDIELVKIDFNDSNKLESKLTIIKEKYASCDCLINCAATYSSGDFLNIESEDILKHFTINTLPAFILMKNIIPFMLKKNWGRIVNISSIGVKYGGGENSFAYSLSKYALEFFPADYKRWASKNVLINTLRVGVVNTKFHNLNPKKDMKSRVNLIPIKRMASVNEVAKMIWFLGSDLNTYITGQVISFSGGE
jgi:3-oxoacyl-[acyl-carrier protein] reductase